MHIPKPGPFAVLFLSLCAACAPVIPHPAASTAFPSPATFVLPTTFESTAAPGTLPSVSPDQLEEVLLQVERLRGIEARRAIPATMVAQTEIGRLTQSALLADWPLPSLEREVRLLQRFGLTETAVDLEALSAPLGLGASVVSEVAGDSLAISTDLRLVDQDLAQVACAFDRLLLAQAFPDSAIGRQAAVCGSNGDACLANRALLEGDTVLLAEQWQRTFGASPLPLGDAPAGCLASASLLNPDASGLVRVLAFPVQQGVGFARSLFLKAGWAGIDQAYASPPVSTEQILHPERYPKDTPRPPVFPDLSSPLGLGWTTEDSGVLGEWLTLLALQPFLDSDEAMLAAGGWDGDRYSLLTNPEAELFALVLLTRWDTVRDAHEFSGAFRTYGENRFGASRRTGTSLTWTTPDGLVILDVGSDQTLWIEAPDAEVAAALRKASGFPLR